MNYMLTWEGEEVAKEVGLLTFSGALSSVYILSATRYTTLSRRPDTLTNLPQIRHFYFFLM